MTETATIPAPTGGWNTRDNIAFMAPQYARELENLFPKSSHVEVRRPTREHADGMGSGIVGTIASLVTATGAEKLIVCANSNIYDASTYDASATSIGSGYSSDRWQHTVFRNRLWLANGVDTLQVYDGTTLGNSTFTSIGTLNISGVVAHKSRLYLTEKDSGVVWYGGVNSITSGLNSFDFAGVFREGGYLLGCASLSRASGDGDQNHFVALGSSGEILLYKGSYPGAAEWELVQRVVVPRILGRRAWTAFGSDLVVATRAGVYALSEMLKGKAAGTETPVTDKVNNEWVEWGKRYSNNTGWDVTNFPASHMLVINVPKTATESFQVVINTQTGACCKYTGINTQVWGTYNSKIYYGGYDGKVYQAEVERDESTESIAYILKQAYIYLGKFRGMQKKANHLAPLIEADANTEVSVAFDVDYQRAKDWACFSLERTITPYGSPYGSPYNTPKVYFTTKVPMVGTGRTHGLKMKGSISGGTIKLLDNEVYYKTIGTP